MKRQIYLTLIACLCCAFAWSQARQVTGRVVSDSSRPLSGVNVNVKGTNTTVATNNDGRFSITVPNNNAVLLFSYVGYTAQTVTVGNKTSINVTLASTSNSLSDVVVIGYQTVRRRDLLASVSSVSAKDLKDIPINSAAEALNGRLAGVTATTSEGSPDATIRIRVRGGMSITGDNSPLYVVDGVQIENALNTLSPQDIQSIDVLKDAAATAIYGARGANGVIIITTKSGRPGRTIVSYNGFIGVKTLAKELAVLDPYDFVFYQSERSRGSGTDSLAFLNEYGQTWDTLKNYISNVSPVDWQALTFGRTGMTTTHNVSATGGNNRITYNFGYTYNNEKAIVLNSDYKRHLVNAKMDYKVTNNIKFGITGRLFHQDVAGAGVSSDLGSSYNRLRNAVKYRPFLSPGQGLYSQDIFNDPNVGNGLVLYNPILLTNSEYRNKTTDAYNVTANINYNITKNLTFRSTFGYNYNQFEDRQFFDSITPNAIINGARMPILYLDTAKQTTITNSNVFTYSLKNVGGTQNIDILAGEETYDLNTESRSSRYKNFPLLTPPSVAIKNTALANTFAGYPRLAKSRYTSLSFFGRINYSLLDKYLFSFNVRADGASKFAPGRQWGYFPSGSFAWRIKKENFLKNVDFVNDLKFRVGYGTVGNNRIGDYLFITTFSDNGAYYYGLNGQSVIAYYPGSLPNPYLQWESTVNKNIGVDFSFTKNRFNLSFDYYDNRSKDLLLFVPIASTYGYTQQYQNVGKTSNKGVEVQLNTTIVQKRGFTWTANFNISHNKNQVLQLGPNQTQFFPPTVWGVSGQPSDYLIKVGQPVGVIYGLVTDGFYNVSDFDYNPTTRIYTLKSGVVNDAAIIGTVAPGSIKFKDLNNDGVVDLNNDRTVIGNTNSKFTGGLNQQFTYKQWDASVFVNFSYGNDVYNANKIEMTNGYSINSNLLSVMAGRWRTVTPDGQTVEYINSTGQVIGIDPASLSALNANATIWQPIRGAGAFYPHSWAIEDGSFLRVNNITIGYSVPVRNLRNLKMTRLRFYATLNNVAIITGYSGYDPEVSVRNNPLTPGLDYSAYPKSRTYIFGVNASF